MYEPCLCGAEDCSRCFPGRRNIHMRDGNPLSLPLPRLESDDDAYILGDVDAWFAEFESGDMAEAYDLDQIVYQNTLAQFGKTPPPPYDASMD